MSKERFGSYQVIRRIAVGGMGEIFLARQVGLHGFERLAVVKTVIEGPTENAERREMFLAEARLAALLNHPNIVQVYELGEENSTLFMAMEYVEGENVGRVAAEARRREQLHIWPFVDVVTQAARALHHAHQMHDSNGNALHMVHRDISPQNIMVRLDGAVKVLDFGIAKVANASLRTRTGMFKGKPAYMAPEQVNHREVDCRADVFALGVVLWELTLGCRMFPDMGDYDILKHAMDQPRPAPTTVNPGYPAALADVVMKAVALDPAQRWQTARDMADALDVLLRATSADDNPPLGTYVSSLVGDMVKTTRDVGTPEHTAVQPADDQGSITPQRLLAAHDHAAPTVVEGRRAAARNATVPPPAVTHRRWTVALGALLVLAAGGGISVWLDAAAPQGDSEGSTEDIGAVTSGRPQLWSTAVVATPQTTDGGITDGGDAGDASLTATHSGRPAPASPAPRHEPAPAEPEAAPVRMGRLTVGSQPWAHVTLDGTLQLGSTPLYAVELPAGRHELTLVNEARKLRKVVTVDIVPGKLTKIRVPLRP